MNCVYGKEIYIGKGVVRDAYLAFDGARVAGISSRPRGKWASFAGWNGDPFALTSWPVSVWGEGKQLYSEGAEGDPCARYRS
jgi:hypothetical protein